MIIHFKPQGKTLNVAEIYLKEPNLTGYLHVCHNKKCICVGL